MFETSGRKTKRVPANPDLPRKQLLKCK